MAEDAREYWLIVEPRPVPGAELPVLTQSLGGLGIDPYNARQRLVGRGPALLGRGRRESLNRAAALLADYGYRHWLLAPSPPSCVPQRVFSLLADQDSVTFRIREREIALGRGDRLLAVLADVSGKVLEKSLRRLVIQHAYQGSGQQTAFTNDEFAEAILRAGPVLDLYRFSPPAEATEAVRLLPGRFDPKGLGERAALSAAGNLRAVLEAVRATGAELHLCTDFGFATLPGCQPARPEEDPDHPRAALEALTRFGALMVQMRSAEPPILPGDGEPPLVVGPPNGIGQFLAEELGGERRSAVEAPPPSSPLPPPPAPPHGGAKPLGIPSGWLLSMGGGSAFVGILAAFLTFSGRLIPWWQNGVLPSLLSLGLLVPGFRLLQLKRLMENHPTSKVRSLSMGMVELQGRAERKYALVSPMAHLPCVYYRVRRYRKKNNEGGGWMLTSEMHSGHIPFYLNDGTGRIVVNPVGATIRPRHREEGYPGQATLLFDGIRGNDRTEKWVEEVIPEGTFLYLLGNAHPARPARQPIREMVNEALQKLKRDPQALSRYDADRNGHISREEWETARAEVEEDVRRRTLTEKRPAKELAEIGRPRFRQLPFIIAETASELQITRKFGFIVPLLLLFGFVAGIWGAVNFLHTMR